MRIKNFYFRKMDMSLLDFHQEVKFEKNDPIP